MFEHKIANLIKSLAPKTYKSIINRGVTQQVNHENKTKKENDELRRNALLISFEQKFPIDSFVIAIPNEAENPVVGKITGYVDTGSTITEPLLKVYDYVRKEELVIPCFTLPYSECFLKGVMAQDVHQRHLSYYKTKKSFNKISDDLILKYEDLVTILKFNGFYQDLKKFEMANL